MAIIASNAKYFADGRGYSFGFQPLVSYGTNLRFASQLNDVNALDVYSFNGANWLLDKTYTDVYMESPTMCKSELNDIFLAYKMSSASPFTIKVKKRDHTSGIWTEVLSQSVTFTNAGGYSTPLMVYNRAINRLHLFWTQIDGTTGAYQRKICNKYSDDYGGSWSAINEYNYGSPGAFAWFYGFAIDTHPLNGNIYVFVCAEGTGGSVELFNYSGIRQSTNYTVTGITNLYDGEVAVSSAGDVYIASRTRNVAATHGVGVVKNGSGIGGGGSSGSDLWYYQSLGLGIDNSDNVYLFYQKRADGKAYWQMWNGSTWTSEAALTSGTGYRIAVEVHTYMSSTKINMCYFTSA